jgi:hypothetical protein
MQCRSRTHEISGLSQPWKGSSEVRNLEVINGLQHDFEKWVERCKKCIACQARYFEKRRPSPHLHKVPTQSNKVIPRTFQTALVHYRHEAFAAVKNQVEVFWVVTPCRVVVGYQLFRGPCCLSIQRKEEEAWTATLHGVTTQKISTWIYIYDGKSTELTPLVAVTHIISLTYGWA